MQSSWKVLIACSLGCADPRPAEPARDAPALLPGGTRVATLEVVPDVEGLSRGDLALLAEGEVAVQVRQGALDALEQMRRYDPEGDVTVRVVLLKVSMRSQLATLLLSHRAGADRLVAEVEVHRAGVPVGILEVDASTSLGGRQWRDPGRRLARLARELALRISERL